MGRRTFSPEQNINKLREAEVYLSQGASVGEASREVVNLETLHPYTYRRKYLKQ
ncbi:MAG: hypothetical protein WBC11_02345 [Dehalococcoidia bacterium]